MNSHYFRCLENAEIRERVESDDYDLLPPLSPKEVGDNNVEEG